MSVSKIADSVLIIIEELARVNCYGCQREIKEPGWFAHDQKSHDRCLMTSKEDKLDLYFNEALAKIGNCAVHRYHLEELIYEECERKIQEAEVEVIIID
jgi:hypothetical protein